jgi:hypothetical protein
MGDDEMTDKFREWLEAEIAWNKKNVAQIRDSNSGKRMSDLDFKMLDNHFGNQILEEMILEKYLEFKIEVDNAL